MNGATVRHNRLSLSAVVMLFILGLFTALFVDTIAGMLIIILSVILYLVLVWLTARFGKNLEQGAGAAKSSNLLRRQTIDSNAIKSLLSFFASLVVHDDSCVSRQKHQ